MTLVNEVKDLQTQVGLQASQITRILERLEKAESRLEILEIAVETPRPLKRNNRHEELDIKILAMIDHSKPYSTNAGAVASNLGIPTQTANDRLKALANQGLINKEKSEGQQINYSAKEV